MDDEAEWTSTVTVSYWYQRKGQIKIVCLLHALLKEVQEWIAVIWPSDRVRRSCRSS
jgi:hypothetical protein